MKLRLNSNAIRLRLSQTEVAKLALEGLLEEQIKFSKDIVLCYRLIVKEEICKPATSYAENTITVFIPKNFAYEWPNNNVTGTSAIHTTEDGTEIFILIEKDFKCLDNTEEDQTDNFANPKLIKQ